MKKVGPREKLAELMLKETLDIGWLNLQECTIWLIFLWGQDKIKLQSQLREEEHRDNLARQAQQERELFERLKAKYEPKQ